MSNYIDLGPEMFTDGKVISYKGENYYRACDKFVCNNRQGGQSFCVKRVGHFWECESYDGTRRYEENMVQTASYIRKPLVVEGVQVSANNMDAVADWCGGKVDVTPSKRTFIKLQVKPSALTRQSMAFAGDWVLKSDMGFKIYSKRAFERTFDEHLS